MGAGRRDGPARSRFSSCWCAQFRWRTHVIFGHEPMPLTQNPINKRTLTYTHSQRQIETNRDRQRDKTGVKMSSRTQSEKEKGKKNGSYEGDAK